METTVNCEYTLYV